MGTFVYHGTSKEQWSIERKSPPPLYVSDDLHVASHYANEWSDLGHTPIVLAFDLDDLAARSLTFVPNEETLEQYEAGYCGEKQKLVQDMTWRDTLHINGTFAIRDFIDELKILAVFVNPERWINLTKPY